MKVPHDLDAKVDAAAAKILPVLKDALQRTEGLTFEYNKENWSVALMALTERIPRQLTALGMDKDTKMEILGAIDMLDRMNMTRGEEPTAEVMLRSLVMVADLLTTLRAAIGLKVIQEGEDVTNEIFGP